MVALIRSLELDYGEWKGHSLVEHAEDDEVPGSDLG